MCYYITATLPMKADLARLGPIAAEHRRTFELLRNPHVEAQLGPSIRYYLTTVGHCDCGTALGSARLAQARSSAINPSKQVTDLRRRGWSERKIERWLEQKAGAAMSRERIRAGNAHAHTPNSTDGCHFIRAVLASGGTDSLGLLLHWYSGALDSECIELLDRQSIRVSTLDDNVLAQLSEDVLYEFRV